MERLNDLYVSIDNWYKKQEDEDFINQFMYMQNWYHKNNFQKLLYWRKETSQLPTDIKDYYLGNNEITFEIVRNFLSDIYPICTEKDLIKLSSGDLDDDENHGGVDYDLRSTRSLHMIFSYLYYKLNWDKKEFENHLYNSLQYTEELEDMFDIYTMPSDDEIENIIEKHIKELKIKDENDFNSEIKTVIDKFRNKEEFEDRLSILKRLKHGKRRNINSW